MVALPRKNGSATIFRQCIPLSEWTEISYIPLISLGFLFARRKLYGIVATYAGFITCLRQSNGAYPCGPADSRAHPSSVNILIIIRYFSNQRWKIGSVANTGSVRTARMGRNSWQGARCHGPMESAGRARDEIKPHIDRGGRTARYQKIGADLAHRGPGRSHCRQWLGGQARNFQPVIAEQRQP